MAELTRILREAVVAGLRSALRTTTRPPSAVRRPQSGPPAGSPTGLRLEYAPKNDGSPDPGEIVWTWVPFEENDGRGKDRPVLLIARRGNGLVGLMLTSKDHDRDAADELRHGRRWMDIGAGDWDAQRRPSEVRLDRLIDVDPQAVRRESALDRARFDQVADAFRALHGR